MIKSQWETSAVKRDGRCTYRIDLPIFGVVFDKRHNASWYIYTDGGEHQIASGSCKTANEAKREVEDILKEMIKNEN